MLHGSRSASLSLFVLAAVGKKRAIVNVNVLVMLDCCDSVIAAADQNDGPLFSIFGGGFFARLCSNGALFL